MDGPVRALAVALVTGSLLAGCGSDALTGGRGPYGEGGTDSVNPDASPPIRVGDGTMRSGFDGGAPAPSADGEGLAFAGAGSTTCYDNLDNNGDGLTDCADPTCAGSPTCAIGNPELCNAAPLWSYNLIGCIDGPDLCDASLTPFGTPAPWIAAEAFHPGGDDMHDSGAVLDAPFDLTDTRVEITATFGDEGTCGSGCIEAAGLSLSAQSSFGDTTQVHALVGLLLSSSRHEMVLIVGGEPVHRWVVVPGASETWTLTTKPTGVVTVGRATGPTVSVAFAPAASARLVLHGRNHNRASTSAGGARVKEVTVSSGLCDMPGAWANRAAVTIIDSVRAAYTPVQPSAPSIATNATGEVAFAFGDTVSGAQTLMFGRRGGGPTTEVLLNHVGSQAALSASQTHDASGLRDPEVVWDQASDQWVVYYTALAADGTQSIGRAVSGVVGAQLQLQADPLPAVAPSSFDDIDGLEMPTVATVASIPWIMIARATMSGDGSQRLIPFTSTDGVAWHRYYGSSLESQTARTSGSAGSAFDAQEIADPALSIRNGGYQLHYAGRRGTRWNVGLLASDDLSTWVSLSESGPVFAASGSGFDRLGARAPDVAGAGTRLEMIYLGRGVDGWSLGIASRRARLVGAP